MINNFLVNDAHNYTFRSPTAGRGGALYLYFIKDFMHYFTCSAPGFLLKQCLANFVQPRQNIWIIYIV